MHLTTERDGPYRVLGITAPYYFKLGFDTLVIYHQPVVTVEIAYLCFCQYKSGSSSLSVVSIRGAAYCCGRAKRCMRVFSLNHGK